MLRKQTFKISLTGWLGAVVQEILNQNMDQTVKGTSQFIQQIKFRELVHIKKSPTTLQL